MKEDRQMKRATLVLASLGLMFGGVGQAKADMVFGPSASLQLFGTGWGGQIDSNATDPHVGDNNPALGTLSVSVTGTGASILPASYTQSSYDGGFYANYDPTTGKLSPWQLDGYIQINASATVRAAGGTLGLDLTNSTNVLIDPATSPIGGYAFSGFSSTAQVSQQDQINLTWTKTGPIPSEVQDLLTKGLINGYLLEGSLQAGSPTGFYGNPEISATVGLTVDAINSPVFSQELVGSGVDTITPTLSIGVPLKASGDGVHFSTPTYSVGLQINVDNAGSGSFGHTLAFQSLTFADGSTPEQRGFEVDFASGIESPNAAATAPEPSTLTLLGIGTVALGGCGWRRRRQRA
jgi:hypothetical protein